MPNRHQPRACLLALAVPLICAAPGAGAQSAPTEFPEGATTLTPEALKEALAGKVFTVAPASGSPWRWQFNGNGYFYINIGSFSDSGKWQVKDSAVCTEGRQIKYSCNEMRSADGVLHMKRDSGEVVKLTAQ